MTSVELDGDKAVGVNFSHAGNSHNVKVNREVIVSCGALQTPQILELSGIGDPEVLKAAGVQCKIENKGVGANFQDHSLTVSPCQCCHSCQRANICTRVWASNSLPGPSLWK